jgi:hypothetical protein
MPRILRLGLLAASLVAAGLQAVSTATAAPIFTGGVGGISFGVADLGPPVNPGAPLYLLNNFNLRNDILINPGLGLTADLSIPNNTLSVGPVAFTPGQYVWAAQVGGGNANGPFGKGLAIIRGDRFGYYLQDGGIPGGISASYQILSWDASFIDPVGSPVGTIGTFIAMKGRVPLVQDLALASLRTQLLSPALGGAVEIPGMILGLERTGPLTFAPVLISDTLVGPAMPWGGAVIVDNAVTGDFRALIYTVFPDLGAIDGFAIPAGAAFTARVTATTIADPSDFEFFMPDPILDADLFTAAFNLNGVPFPNNPLFTPIRAVPELGALALAVVPAALAFGTLAARRARRRNG